MIRSNSAVDGSNNCVGNPGTKVHDFRSHDISDDESQCCHLRFGYQVLSKFTMLVTFMDLYTVHRKLESVAVQVALSATQQTGCGRKPIHFVGPSATRRLAAA